MRLFLYLIFLSFFYATSARCTGDLPRKHAFAEKWDQRDDESQLSYQKSNENNDRGEKPGSSISAEKWDWEDDESVQNNPGSDDINKIGENRDSSFSSEKSDRRDDKSQESDDENKTGETHDSSSSLEQWNWEEDVSQQSHQEVDNKHKTGESKDSSQNSDSHHSEENSDDDSDSDNDSSESGTNSSTKSRNDSGSDSGNESDSASEGDSSIRSESDGNSDSKLSSLESGDDDNWDHTQNDKEKNVSHDSVELQSLKQEDKKGSAEQDETRQNYEWQNWYKNPEGRGWSKLKKSLEKGFKTNSEEERGKGQWSQSLETDGDKQDDEVKGWNEPWEQQHNSWKAHTGNEWKGQNEKEKDFWNQAHNERESKIQDILWRLKKTYRNTQDAKVKGWNEPWVLQDHSWDADTGNEWEGQNESEKDLWNPSHNVRQSNTRDALWKPKGQGWNQPWEPQDGNWNAQTGNEWEGQKERRKDSWNSLHVDKKLNANDNNWDGLPNDNNSNELDQLSDWTKPRKPQEYDLNKAAKENEMNQPEKIAPGKHSDKNWKPKKKGKKPKNSKKSKTESTALEKEKGHPDQKSDVEDYPEKIPGDLEISSDAPKPWSPSISNNQDKPNLKTDDRSPYDNQSPDYSNDSGKSDVNSHIDKQTPILEPHHTPESSVDGFIDGSPSEEPNTDYHDNKETPGKDTASVPTTGQDTKDEQTNNKDHDKLVTAEADLINHKK